jgi:hypothetical protein
MVKHKADETHKAPEPQQKPRTSVPAHKARAVVTPRVYVPLPNYTPTPTPHELSGFMTIVQTPAYHVPLVHKWDGSPVQPTGANPNPVAPALPTTFYDAAGDEVLPT